MNCEHCGGTGIKQDESKCPCGAEPVTAEEILRVLEPFALAASSLGSVSILELLAARTLYHRLSEEEKQP